MVRRIPRHQSEAPLVRKGIIPAAGEGTRMRPLSSVLPKELFPIGSRPALDFVVAEAAAAGLKELLLVIRREKELIRTYLEQVRGQWPEVRFRFVYQQKATGLADALLLCRPWLDPGEPFAVLLPDNVLFSPFPFGRMLRLFEERERDVVGVIRLNSRHSRLFGNSGRIDWRPLRPGVVEITALHDKEEGLLRIGPGETLLRSCGRYVCQPHLLDYLEEERARVAGELDEVSAYQRIVREKGLLGRILRGPLYDVGHPRGYLAACTYYRRKLP